MSKFSEVFKKYKTYDDSNGRGSVDEWRHSFESIGSKEAKNLLKNKNPLSILGLAELPSLEKLKTIYRKLLLTNHPDRGGNHSRCKEIIAAFKVLENKFK